MSGNSIVIESNAPETSPVIGCGCDWRGTLADVEDVNETGATLEAGDASPAGRCPECGGLVYLDRPEDRARDNAPAMLAALRRILSHIDPYYGEDEERPECFREGAAILARIDGTPTA